MLLEARMKGSYASLKAPEGKFAVYAWDPSNPEKSIPIPVSKSYGVEGFAIGYAKRMNAKQQAVIGEADYFVMNDQGIKVY